jgi:hypothetical protein
MENSANDNQPQALGHSKWGILSFLVSLVMSIVGGLILSNAVQSLEGRAYVPLMYCLFPVGYLLGIGSAIAGLRERNRKRLFSVLGLIINIFASFPMLLMWVLGLMAGLPFSCLPPSFCK